MKNLKLAILAAVACLAAVALLSTSSAPSPREAYQQWKKDFGKAVAITAQEDEYRFMIFKKNLEEIEEHNAKQDKTYTVGVNQFTALTRAEFKELYLSTYEVNSNYEEDYRVPPNFNVDWITYGAVSPVKNEGGCKANYAFSAVGAIEGVSVITYHQQTEYSSQEPVDCSQSYGNQGCSGGNMVNVFNWVRTRGINTDASYPYQGRLQSCQTSTGIFRISGYGTVSSCFNLDSSLQVRPISVAVDGNNFYNYQSGIFNNCGTNVSLGTLLVAGTDQYYKLKLSWGTSWGEAGYIRLFKGNNVCGICMAASYPLP